MTNNFSNVLFQKTYTWQRNDNLISSFCKNPYPAIRSDCKGHRKSAVRKCGKSDLSLSNIVHLFFGTTKACPGSVSGAGSASVTVASTIYQRPSGSRVSVRAAILHQGWMPTEASICKAFPAKTPGRCAGHPHIQTAGQGH